MIIASQVRLVAKNKKIPRMPKTQACTTLSIMGSSNHPGVRIGRDWEEKTNISDAQVTAAMIQIIRFNLAKYASFN